MKEEVAEVAAFLATEQDREDPHRLLVILGRANAVEYRDPVAKYLERRDDPMLPRVALDVLCNDWGLTEAYLPAVKALARGEPWDEGEDARLMAISVAGYYLRDQEDKDQELLSMLLAIFMDPNEDRITRQAAYSALARAVGKDWREIPGPSRHFDPDKDVDQRILEQVQKILEC